MRETLRQIEAEIPRLRRYARCLRLESDHADDLVQKCLGRAIAKLHTSPPDANLRAWLFVILRNCHINETRRDQWAEALYNTAINEPSLSPPGNQETSVALSEAGNAFLGLSEEHREVLLLIAIEGLSYQEAAALLAVPPGTVLARLTRARDALRQALGSAHQALVSPQANRMQGVRA